MASTLTGETALHAAPAHTGKRWAFRARGLMGTLVMLAFGALAIFSPPHFPEATWGEWACDTVAWCFFVAGAGFRFWSTLYIGGRKTHILACEGPYSICRNPLYVGTFLGWLSAAIFLQSITLAVGALLGIAFYRWFTVPAEEAQLRAILGQPYEDYCRQTPRFIPRFSQFRTPATITVTTHGLWLECRRATRWIGMPAFAELLSHLRCEDGWPHWFMLP